MKYFLDTEFHEYTKKVTLLGITIEKVNTIELISIGMVCEDGRTFYAISRDFDIPAAWNNGWLRENVLKSVYTDLIKKESNFGRTYFASLMQFDLKGMKNLIRWHGMGREDIADAIFEFCNPHVKTNTQNWTDHLNKHRVLAGENINPHFYAYYADYDWVVFCWIFGRMIELPNGFPKYCRDLKQMYDEKQESISSRAGFDPEYKTVEALFIKSHGLKQLPEYPQKSVNEHNALADAVWNKELYDFLQK